MKRSSFERSRLEGGSIDGGGFEGGRFGKDFAADTTGVTFELMGIPAGAFLIIRVLGWCSAADTGGDFTTGVVSNLMQELLAGVFLMVGLTVA